MKNLAPQVRQFESLDALIQIFQEPGEFAKQLKLLRDAEKALNEKYKIAANLQEGESYLAEATAKRDEARDIRRQADEYLAIARTRAEGIVAEAVTQAEGIKRDATATLTQAQAKLQEAAGAMDTARATQRNGQAALETARQVQADAENLMSQAQAIKVEYENRLSAMRKLAS